MRHVNCSVKEKTNVTYWNVVRLLDRKGKLDTELDPSGNVLPGRDCQKEALIDLGLLLITMPLARDMYQASL